MEYKQSGNHQQAAFMYLRICMTANLSCLCEIWMTVS
jgi:hypothetical protein